MRLRLPDTEGSDVLEPGNQNDCELYGDTEEHSPAAVVNDIPVPQEDDAKADDDVVLVDQS